MNNPQAFPVPGNFAEPDKDEDRGMSLRDYFAGQALAGIISSQLKDNVTAQMIAIACYDQADAMLKAREGK